MNGQKQDRRPRRRPSAIAKAARRLGIERLRPEQTQVIQAVLGGKDVLAVLPTGFGKSACYQIPSMVLPKPVVVVSPLLALLKDQHDRLRALGVEVVRVDSTVQGAERRSALERLARGGSLLVMTTPETLGRSEMGAALAASGVSTIAVDEAHMASEWGHDFRPAYLRIGEVISRHGSPVRLALTATATAAVREDIVRILGMRDPAVLVASPDRPNLRFQVIECVGAARVRALTRLVLRLPRPGIIYCSTTKDVDAVFGALGKLRVPMHHYHGRLSQSQRRQEQEQFMSPRRRVVMVATSAFGLGIDKRDIRYVIHYQAPASLEQYVQEAGRAGRDGTPAHCILLHGSEDRQIHEFLLSQSRVRPDQLERLQRALSAWSTERTLPTPRDIALTARLPQKTVSALLAPYEEAGLLSVSSAGKVRQHGSRTEFREAARRLVQHLLRLRELDAERLDAMASYATTRRCRAQQIRKYFGVAEGQRCGRCDVCTGLKNRPDTFFEPLKRAPSRRQSPKGRTAPKRRRKGAPPRSGGKRSSLRRT